MKRHLTIEETLDMTMKWDSKFECSGILEGVVATRTEGNPWEICREDHSWSLRKSRIYFCIGIRKFHK